MNQWSSWLLDCENLTIHVWGICPIILSWWLWTFRFQDVFLQASSFWYNGWFFCYCFQFHPYYMQRSGVPICVRTTSFLLQAIDWYNCLCNCYQGVLEFGTWFLSLDLEVQFANLIPDLFWWFWTWIVWVCEDLLTSLRLCWWECLTAGEEVFVYFLLFFVLHPLF